MNLVSATKCIRQYFSCYSNDLTDKNEIPEKLVKITKSLRYFENIDARAEVCELNENEIPVVKALIYSVLEYIYSVPDLASIA